MDHFPFSDFCLFSFIFSFYLMFFVIYLWIWALGPVKSIAILIICSNSPKNRCPESLFVLFDMTVWLTNELMNSWALYYLRWKKKSLQFVYKGDFFFHRFVNYVLNFYSLEQDFSSSPTSNLPLFWFLFLFFLRERICIFNRLRTLRMRPRKKQPWSEYYFHSAGLQTIDINFLLIYSLNNN